MLRMKMFLSTFAVMAFLLAVSSANAFVSDSFTISSRSFHEGDNGIRVANGVVHLVYASRYGNDESIVYVRYNEADSSTQNLPIDLRSYIGPTGNPYGLPIIEIGLDGEIIVLYSKVATDYYGGLPDLYYAIIHETDTGFPHPEPEIVSQGVLRENVVNEAVLARSEDLMKLFVRDSAEIALSSYESFHNNFLDVTGIPGNIRFWGADQYNGRVHANSDIWIRQAGGGPNNGWPLFNDLVTVAGEVMVYPGGGTNYPVDDIFPGGLIENHSDLGPGSGMDEIRRSGMWPFGVASYDNRIAFVTIEGSTFTSWVGDIQQGPVEEIIVYDSYPPYGPIGDSISVNTVTRVDTVWFPGPSGSLVDGSAFVPFELWISGNVAGQQTWGSSQDIYIKGDLTYANTTPGLPPDGGPEGLYPINETDFLGLVSEKSIKIQYGYRCPVDSMRYKPNTNDIYIYGSLAALGNESGEMLDHDAGVFTYQYQHPKGSTPAQEWEGDFYDNIDLHRYHYPTSVSNPWPPGLDYPWYNPLWPEPGPVFDHPQVPNPHGAEAVTYLRGTVNFFGSIAQMRNGYLRRSGNADFDTGLLWDIDNHIYGRHPGQPSGYDKNTNYDTRLENNAPPHFPKTFSDTVSMYSGTEFDDFNGFDEMNLPEMVPFGLDETLNVKIIGNKIAIFGQDRQDLWITFNNGVDWIDYPALELAAGFEILNMYATDDFIVFSCTYSDNDSDVYLMFYDWDLENIHQTSFSSQFNKMISVAAFQDKIVVAYDQFDSDKIVLQFFESSDNGIVTGLSLNVETDVEIPANLLDFDRSRLGLHSDDESLVLVYNYVFRNSPQTTQKVKLVSLQLPVPENLTADVNDTSIALDWSQPDLSSEQEEYFNGFSLYRNHGLIAQLEPDELYYLDEVSDPEAEYIYYVRAVYDYGLSKPSNEVIINPVNVVDDISAPIVTKLKGNFPNPFNPSTRISYSLEEDTESLSIRIFNIKGQLIRELYDGFQERGVHEIYWDGTDNRGRKASSGLYFYRMSAGSYSRDMKMLLLK
jgi:hypothetical protein